MEQQQQQQQQAGGTFDPEEEADASSEMPYTPPRLELASDLAEFHAQHRIPDQVVFVRKSILSKYAAVLRAEVAEMGAEIIKKGALMPQEWAQVLKELAENILKE